MIITMSIIKEIIDCPYVISYLINNDTYPFHKIISMINELIELKLVDDKEASNYINILHHTNNSNLSICNGFGFKHGLERRIITCHENNNCSEIFTLNTNIITRYKTSFHDMENIAPDMNYEFIQIEINLYVINLKNLELFLDKYHSNIHEIIILLFDKRLEVNDIEILALISKYNNYNILLCYNITINSEILLNIIQCCDIFELLYIRQLLEDKRFNRLINYSIINDESREILYPDYTKHT